MAAAAAPTAHLVGVEQMRVCKHKHGLREVHPDFVYLVHPALPTLNLGQSGFVESLRVPLPRWVSLEQQEDEYPEQGWQLASTRAPGERAAYPFWTLEHDDDVERVTFNVAAGCVVIHLVHHVHGREQDERSVSWVELRDANPRLAGYKLRVDEAGMQEHDRQVASCWDRADRREHRLWMEEHNPEHCLSDYL